MFGLAEIVAMNQKATQDAIDGRIKSNPTIKENTISNMVSNGCSKKAILKEIEKCESLCANCRHIIHHYGDVV